MACGGFRATTPTPEEVIGRAARIYQIYPEYYIAHPPYPRDDAP